MPKLYSSKEIIKVLEQNGFMFVSQKGSHVKYFHKVKKLTVIIPAERKAMPMGTFHSILRQSCLTKGDFER